MAKSLHELQQELAQALTEAEQRVSYLRGLIARNEMFTGDAIAPASDLGEGGEKPLSDPLSRVGLQGDVRDMSDYLGSEDVPHSRPRIGNDAPEYIKPKEAPPVSPLLHQVVTVHPDDCITHESGHKQPSSSLPAVERVQNSTGESGITAEASQPETKTRPAGDIISSEGMAGTVLVFGGDQQRSSLADTKALPGTESPAVVEAHVPGQGNRASAFAPCSPCLETTPSQAQERAMYAMQALSSPIWDWDILQGCTWCSPEWIALFGESEGWLESPLERVLQQMTAEDASSLRYRFDSVFSGAAENFTVPVRFTAIDQGDVVAVLHVLCVRDSSRIPMRIFLILGDTQPVGQFATNRTLLHGGHSFAEVSSDITARFDTNGELLFISPSISRYVPIEPENLIGQPFPEMGKETTLVTEYLRWVADLGFPFQVTLDLKAPLVGEFQADCHFWPEFGPEGEVISVMAHIEDRTFARCLADNYKSLFTGMADGFAVFEHLPLDPGTQELHAENISVFAMNSAFARLFQLDESAVVGRSLSRLLGQDAEYFVQQCIAGVLPAGKTINASFLIAARGIFLEVTTYAPEPGRIACIAKDVTERIQMMQEVRLNEARIAALYRLSHMDAAPEEEVVQFSLDQAVQLTGSNIGFLAMAHDDGRRGKTKYWSRELLDLYDYDMERLPEIPEELLRGSVHAEGGAFRRAEIVNTQQDKESISIGDQLQVQRFMVAPVVEEGRIVCIAGVVNKNQPYEQSDLRQLELFINGMWFQLRRRWSVQDLQKAKDAAEAASRAKNEFLANVSHELRTPLNGILGMLQLLQQSPLSSTQLEYVVTANYSGRSLLRIISDILDFSRIEAGRLELAPQVFDFAATVRSTLGMFVHQAEQKKITFVLRMSKNIPRFVLGDDARVRQIMFNLVGNAFKFTEAGEVVVECHPLPYSPAGKCMIYFSVSDTGIGIPEDSLADIFTAFKQLDGSSTRKYQGTGLGLGIVRRLLHLMDGNISLESVVGNGTTVHCSIPFTLAPEAAYKEEERQPEAGITIPLDILVAEDDPVNRLTIRSLLQKQGHRVVCVENGRQAIEALLLHPFQCLITDIQMPIMDGTELVQRIREGNTSDIEPSKAVMHLLEQDAEKKFITPIPADLPVVALTAHAMTGDKEHFLTLGMDYYLSKPILATDLKKILSQVSVVVQSRGV